MKRGLLALALVAAACVGASSLAAAQPRYEFKLGFKALAEQIPEVVGEPLEDEHHNPLNGDALQQTTKGLMAWRKADNWTAFTDGTRSWINGPFGLQERANDERFEWEVAAPPTETAVPRPAETPIATPGPAPTTTVVSPTPGGVYSAEPAGEWVTSSYPTARYYYHRSDPRWQGLSERYRVWFDSVQELLARFPGRTPAP